MLNKQPWIYFGIKFKFARILKIKQRLKIHFAYCGPLGIQPLVRIPLSSFSTNSSTPHFIYRDAYKYIYFLLLFFCEKMYKKYYFSIYICMYAHTYIHILYHITWIYSLCLLCFSYSHYLWVLSFCFLL